MRIRYVNKDSYKTTGWSGGKTTELFIFPEDADYQTRNFQVRISSASIDDDHSVFTNLQGVTRYLTKLSGEAYLIINGKKVELNPNEVISFSGTDNVESYGKCVDFNLMLKNTDGIMKCIFVSDSETDLNIPANTMAVLFNNSEKCVQLFDQEDACMILPGDLVIVSLDNAKYEENVRLNSGSDNNQPVSMLVCMYKVGNL